MRLIDADEMLSELKPITYEMKQNAVAVTIADMSSIMRNWVCRQPTVPAYEQWVSVKDRLPERNGKYIVTACDEGEPYDEIIWNDTVVVCAEYYKGCWTWEENNTEYSLDGIVTHWMPLPEPPKEVRDDG